MKKEFKLTYKITPIYEHFNENNVLKPYGYQHMFNYLANIHLKGTDQGVGVVILNQYAWVLVSFTIEIIKPITKIEEFIGRTWFSGNIGPYYRREYELKNDKDEIVAVASSFSVLLDMESRSVYRQKELPFKKLEEIKVFLTDAKTRYRENHNFLDVDRRKVYNSHLDNLGHVNNLRYTEFVYDVFDDYDVKNLLNINKFELYFHKEMKLNHEFSIEKAEQLNKSVFNINNLSSNEKAFSLVFYYTKGQKER